MDLTLVQLVRAASLEPAHPSASANALSDYMQDRRITGYSVVRKFGLFVPDTLEGHDWQMTFSYAGEPDSSGGFAKPSLAYPGQECDRTHFNRRAVKTIFACEEGEGEGDDWICVGQLWDGRFFAVRAGCAYSGWDVGEHGECSVAWTKKEIIRFGLDKENRIRLGFALREDR